MSVEALANSEADLRTMLDILRAAVHRRSGPCRQVAACMLRHYTAQQEFPTVRVIAASTHLPLATVERTRHTVLHAWQSVIRRLSL